ncbi:MAG TPA: amino acid permease [Pseudonocardiaceae bacterium]|jgi:urea carboxylase system permease|nr:amino acid permease [Pseudonocardiaceae bacterium]
MSAPVLTAHPTDGPDAEDLRRIGYHQELHRRLGWFSSFAAGFSFVSILTTVFQLFALGYSFGGPAFFWTWPLVFAGQLCVALVFAELAASWPLAGCIYQWSRRLAGEIVGWFAGWAMLVGYIVSVAAIGIALQAVLPAVWQGFQIIGTDPSVTSASGAANGILLGSVLIAIATVISAVGVRFMAVINGIGVTCEIIGVVLLLVLLFSHTERGPGVVTQTLNVSGDSPYVYAFLASTLMAAYVMYGFDSAAELSEETSEPRRVVPSAILRALLVSFVGGGFMIVAALMAAPSLTDGQLSAGGIAYVITSRLDSTLGRALLLVVAISIVSACLAIQNSASRVMFSMARDGRLPGARLLARVHPQTGTPIITGIAVGVLAIAVLLINLGNPAAFAAVTSTSVVIVYLAYLLVTVPALRARLRRSMPSKRPGGFSLGRWGLPVNLFAVVYGVAMMVNIAWPRQAVYDPAGTSWLLQYLALLFVAGLVVVGLVVHRALRGRPTPAAVEAVVDAAAAVAEA